MLLPPTLEFLENLGTAAALAVDGPGAEAIFFFYLILRQQELKVPGRVGRLLIPADAPAAGRVREADALGTVEHQQEQVLAEQHVVERLVVEKRRQVAEQRVAQARAELQLDLVVAVADGALVVVPLRAELLPEPGPAEVDRPVLGCVDVACPEQADVAVGKGMLCRDTAERKVDGVRRDEFEACPA